MPNVPVQFDEWRPDLATLDSKLAGDIENVLAGSNSYLPVPSLFPFTGAAPLPDKLVGLRSARKLDGTWVLIGGTRTKLYRWTPSTVSWTDVSRTTGGAYHVEDGDQWSMDQFGSHMVAVQQGDVPQWIDIESGTNFDALPGNPPIAHHVKQLGDFLILSRLKPGSVVPGTTVATNDRQIMWSGINRPDLWNSGDPLLSDYQEFPDGGPVQGVAGSEIGYVVQDRAVRTMQFLPQDTRDIFSFTRVVEDKGSVSKLGFVSVNNVLYFLDWSGFFALNGQTLQPIGFEKVNEWFLTNTDIGSLDVVQCISANRPWVFWATRSNSAAQFYDLALLYNWANNRWCKVRELAQMWAAIASEPLDLDTTGPEPGDEWLEWAGSPQPQSLDSFFYKGGQPVIAGVDPNGVVGTLSGPALLAKIETAEAHLVPGARAFVSEAYPIADAEGAIITVGTRERLQDPVEWHEDVPIEVTGRASVYTSGRLHRFRVTIPRGEDWTHAQGVLANTQPDGDV